MTVRGGDLPNPKRNLPPATYLALGITTALYVLIAIGRDASVP